MIMPMLENTSNFVECQLTKRIRCPLQGRFEVFLIICESAWIFFQNMRNVLKKVAIKARDIVNLASIFIDFYPIMP